MADLATQLVNKRREREQRVTLTNQAQNGPALAAARADTNPGTTPANGYVKGDTFVSFFTFGVSLLDGPDVLA